MSDRLAIQTIPPIDRSSTEPGVSDCLPRLESLCHSFSNDAIVPAEEPLRQTVARFERDHELVGVLIYDGERLIGPLARGTVFAKLSRAYSRDLYMGKPVSVFQQEQVDEPLDVLPAEMALNDAIAWVIARPSRKRYDPVLVERRARGPSLIDVRDLIGHQCGQLTKAIHEVEHQRREAYHAARHDRLTGLPNRKYALERLESAKVGGQECALLFLDFDQFKLVNDSLGHDAGDDMLVSIARRLEGLLTAFDRPPLQLADDQAGAAVTPFANRRITPVRLGGDEFLLILDPLSDPDEPVRLAEAVLEAMRRPHHIMHQSITSTPSIGVTSSRISGTDANALIRDADTAMYQAKSQGRNCIARFESQMHDTTARKMEVDAALRESLAERAFDLYYQPIVEVDTGQLKGFESLCRWDHPRLGRVSPGEFIPIAEDSGLIDALGRQCLEAAADQVKRWLASGLIDADLYVSVNVSKRQLLAPDMVDHLEHTVADAGLDRTSICLEITETSLSDNRVSVRPVLERLRGLGYRLFIDDFGTGTSSLTSLHDVPADVLKIDRAFILQMQRDLSYTAIVDAVINLARNLDMTVIAEGIEETAQFMQVQALGCDAVQGYLFSKPLPAAEAEALLAENKVFTPSDMAA
jgi:predicted signal transduction protein with EAL and GGDEF domain